MFYKIYIWITEGRNRLWVKPALGSLFAILFALLATATDAFLPESWAAKDWFPTIRQETIETVLNAISTSMLAVTTFSLSIMVASLASVASGASPRATDLVMADDNTQNAIAAFISAFIYSIVAQTALGMGFYSVGGRLVLFTGTLLVLLYLIYTLIMWVKTLSSLGRMANTLERLEEAATESMISYRRSPRMGARPGLVLLGRGIPVHAGKVGYVRYIDMGALQSYASEAGLQLHIRVRPGVQVYPDTALLASEGQTEPDADKVRHAFIIGPARTYPQDPRFGLVVLSEVAQRALSPAVNDPGTAIAVLNTIARILISARPGSEADEEHGGEAPPERDRLTMVDLDESDFITQSFDPISRDGAKIFEVHMRMQKVLAAIGRSGSVSLAPVARRQAARAMQRAEATDMLEQEKIAVRQAFESLHGSVGADAPL